MQLVYKIEPLIKILEQQERTVAWLMRKLSLDRSTFNYWKKIGYIPRHHNFVLEIIKILQVDEDEIWKEEDLIWINK